MKYFFLLFLTLPLTLKAKVTLLSYNTWLLPSVLMISHKPTKRVHAIADYLKKSQIDVIALQEVFSKKNFQRLNSKLSSLNYYSSGKAKKFFGDFTSSGLVTFSKYPIVEQHFEKFKSCYLDDCLSSKGILTTKIKIENEYLYVVNTHLQASNSQPRKKARLSQLKQLGKYLETHPFFKNDGAVILMGDLNVDYYSSEIEKIKSSIPFLDLLNYEGELQYSYDSQVNINLQSKNSRELLDYISHYQNGYDLVLDKNYIIRPLGNYSHFSQRDLSDHFPVFNTIHNL